jgi:general secretion pathway protein D
MVPSLKRLGLRRYVFQALLIGAPFLFCMSQGLFAQESIVARERARRAADASDSQEDLKRGDLAYQKGDYAEAVTAYSAAREKLASGLVTKELRLAATDRLAQASVERARQLNRMGEREEAMTLLDNILAPNVAPDYTPALEMREKILDPLRSNPSLTPETVADIDKVRRLLYEAEGFASLGQFDRAYMMFEEILLVDRYNSAARRGMERMNQARSDHYDAAGDEARSRALADVSAGWASHVIPETEVVPLEIGFVENGAFRVSAREKLKTIIIPMIDLEGVDIYEAVDFLRQKSVDLDLGTLDQAVRGVGVVVDLGNGDSPVAQKIKNTRFNLKLRNVPLGKALDYVNAATNTQSRVDEFAVVIRPTGSTSDELLTRSFRMPPDFLERESVNEQAEGSNPFDDDAGTTDGLLGRRFTALEYFKEQGVSFPEGASAIFRRFDGSLTVRNTETNLDYIEQVVNSINDKEPVMVIIDVTFIKVAETDLEELGYDFLITPLPLGDDVFLGGGTTGNGTPVDDFGFIGQDALTSGNRSGNATTVLNGVDSAINRPRPGTASGSSTTGPNGSGGISNFSSGVSSPTNLRAPGVLSVTGLFTDGVVSAMMRGLLNKKGDDFMIKKSVVTRSGQAATVEATRRMPYPTEYEPPQLPNSIGSTTATDLLTGETAVAQMSFATPATPTAFDVRKLGCVLEVEPLVGPNRHYVEMALKPSLVDFDGFIDYGTPITGGTTSIDFDRFFGGQDNFGNGSFGEVTPNNILMPVFSSTSTNSSVVMADGATLVLGGLLENSRTKFEDSVPILGSLPLIGRFFKSESETNIRTALVIFVKVRLVDPSGQSFSDR